MKYIRTKDNRIIDTTKYYIEGSNLFKNGAYQEYKKELENAVKQADTIEELCDEFVFYKDVEGERVMDNIKHLEGIRQNFLNGYISDVKLTIWTDKGLIYVAEMNEKGATKLL